MYQTRTITDLSPEPVSLAEAKSFLEIDFSDFDTLLGLLITSARQASEQFTGLSYGKKLMELVSDQDKVIIPYGPFVELVSVKDKDGNLIAASNYTIFGYSSPVLNVRLGTRCLDGYDPYWDILGSQRNSLNFYTVQYHTGFYTEEGETITSTLPYPLKEAILKRVANGFQFREDSTEAAVNGCINQSVFLEQAFKTNPML